MSVINYQGEFNKQLNVNISLVRDCIDDGDYVLKIKNHAERYNRTTKEIRDKIMTDDMYAEIFAKDPGKQNIFEKLASQYISELDLVSDFVNLPNSAKIFVVDGLVVNKRQNDVKSVDFMFRVGEKKIYASHKYIKANGGAQDNQYNDVRNYLKNCKKIDGGDVYFIAICDGPYFANKIELLNNEFGSSNIKVMTIDGVVDFVKTISEK
jgi:hypothetical protein